LNIIKFIKNNEQVKNHDRFGPFVGHHQSKQKMRFRFIHYIDFRYLFCLEFCILKSASFAHIREGFNSSRIITRQCKIRFHHWGKCWIFAEHFTSKLSLLTKYVQCQTFWSALTNLVTETEFILKDGAAAFFTADCNEKVFSNVKAALLRRTPIP